MDRALSNVKSDKEVEDLIQLLQELTSCFSPSGYEENASAIFKELMCPLCDEVKQDILGNIICTKRGRTDKTIMIIAHIDEIGLMVKHIEDNGYLRFAKIGGVDVTLLSGRNVTIKHGNNFVNGIIGAYPIHFKTQQESRTLDISELWIDIGTKSLDETLNCVSVGDYIKISSDFVSLRNHMISSGGLDDKCGIAVLVELMTRLQHIEKNHTIVCVASVQEELGGRGAITAAYGISPNVALAIDVTHATDIPNVKKAKFGSVVLGRGPVIPYGCDFDSNFQNKIREIASDNGIAVQVEAVPEHSGTDIHHVKINKAGCVTGLISIPCRYMHTPVETVSTQDILHTVDLIESFIQQL